MTINRAHFLTKFLLEALLFMTHHVTTVFVDMLGFSNLVLENHLSVPLLSPASASSFSALDDELIDLRAREATRLEQWFATFHGAINILVARNAPATGLSAVSFSDSAFIAFEHSNMAFFFARDLMRALLERHVPARMGIAFGSFLGLRYLTDISPPAISIHQSQFLGTSVVLAHHAEACGLKGFRILLDPHLPVPTDCKEYVMTLPAEEQALAAEKGRSAVVSEVAYLRDYAEEKVAGYKYDSYNTATRAVEWLRAKAPEKERAHHDATIAALGRMHQHLGLVFNVYPNPPKVP